MMRDSEMVLGSVKMNQKVTAKPKAFARVERLVSNMLSNPIVENKISTVFAHYMETENGHCNKYTKESSLDLVRV